MENKTEEPNQVPVETKEDTKENNLKKPNIDLKKWLYSFAVKDDDGNSHEFFILKPNRSIKQRGEIEYAKQLAFFVRNGLLPKAAWSTILDNLGGTISEPDAKKYETNRALFIEKSIELNKLQQKTEQTEDDKLKISELQAEINIAQMQIQAFELEQVYIFENTAEAKARNATIQWWMTELAYKNEKEPFFSGETFDEKMDWYDNLNDSVKEDAIKLKAGQRFSYLITMWFLNRINSWEDFAAIDSDSSEK
jgi:hypothetical protein